ncbi:MAG: leucine-rich repeat domain-containing protein [Promethearchaeota archaeon]
MEKFLSPETIYTGLKNKEIDRNIAFDQLISLIEGSNNPKIRSESISVLNQLKIFDPKIFKIVESSLLSDESPYVRRSAVNLIGHHFLKEGIDTLTWVIQHEKSPLVLKAIFDLNLDFTNTQFKSLNKELNQYLVKISSAVGIISKEAKFILDLEALFAENEENYILELTSYQFYTKLKDSKLGEFWLTIKNKHIESLSFNYFNWRYVKRNPGLFNSISKLQDPVVYLNLLGKIHSMYNKNLEVPESISLLTTLRKLNLSKNYIIELPKSMFFLSNLEYLDLSYNMLDEIPEEITKLKSLTSLKIHNNKINKIPKAVSEYLDKLSTYKI